MAAAAASHHNEYEQNSANRIETENVCEREETNWIFHLDEYMLISAIRAHSVALSIAFHTY